MWAQLGRASANSHPQWPKFSSHNALHSHTVIKKFTFRFHSTIILQCECGWKNSVKSFLRTLASCAPLLLVSSVEKFLTTYTRCSLRPTVFYLGYVLGPGSLSLLVIVQCPHACSLSVITCDISMQGSFPTLAPVNPYTEFALIFRASWRPSRTWRRERFPSL